MKLVVVLGALLGFGSLVVGGCSGGDDGGSSTSAESVCRSFYSEAQGCGVLSEGQPPSCEGATGSSTEVSCQTGCLGQADCGTISEFLCMNSGVLSDCLQACVVRFDCSNGDTVPQDWFCDGDDDCGDGSDEPTGCTPSAGSGGPSVPVEEYTCSDGAKIPASYVCDTEPDCSDGGDEAGCATRVCPNTGPGPGTAG